MPEPVLSERGITAVLIHGAWAGGWVWEPLKPLLEEQGLRVLTPDLPGCGARLGDPRKASLIHCVDDLEQQLSHVAGPLLLVGHSGGGAVATQLAEALSERVVGVAFLAGMMLAEQIRNAHYPFFMLFKYTLFGQCCMRAQCVNERGI